MALTKAHKYELAKAELPGDRELRARMDRYMAQAGLTDGDFASLCGYSRSTVNLFKIGAYTSMSGNDGVAVRSAIARVMDDRPVDLEDAPTGTLYPTRNSKILRKYFHLALDRGFAYYIHGNPGTQKSYVTSWLLHELRQSEVGKNGTARMAVVIYCQSKTCPINLLKEIAIELGIPSRGTIPQLMRKIRLAFSGHRGVILFDEAQHLNNDCLEIIRELGDRKPHIGILFVGSHDLDQMFKGFHMEQWRSRIHAGEALPGLSMDEAEGIIRSELGSRFPAKALHQLIEDAQVVDTRKRVEKNQPPAKYISARSLFLAVDGIKEAMSSKGATA